MSTSPSDADFYTNLAPFPRFADVTDLSRYQPAPDSWRVVVTDVRGSTRAIEEGRYKEVNALGTGSIVATLNAVGELDIPYVFGGDGATLLIPASVEAPVESALAGVAKLAEDCFDMDLRVGMVPVAEVRRRSAEVLVARYEASENVSLAMLTGGGAEVAEELIKDVDDGENYRIEPAEGDASEYASLLEGFHCRWNSIESRNGTTLCVLVVALGEDSAVRHATYARVLDELEAAGGLQALHPLSRDTLDLATEASAMSIEARLRTGRKAGFKYHTYATKTALSTRVGNYLMRTGRRVGDFDGTAYPREVIANADYHKFDDALRMVLDVSDEQRRRIESCLARERERGQLAYGLHGSDSALMTCLVFDFQGRHVHFVDGADGGYAMAAKQLKEQLRTG
ncbi:DUF3095 domain-containing protein [Persicimonas caeni]|nr:DUF3095 domain-containing protein [Persicimonas caeni]